MSSVFRKEIHLTPEEIPVQWLTALACVVISGLFCFPQKADQGFSKLEKGFDPIAFENKRYEDLDRQAAAEREKKLGILADKVRKDLKQKRVILVACCPFGRTTNAAGYQEDDPRKENLFFRSYNGVDYELIGRMGFDGEFEMFFSGESDGYCTNGLPFAKTVDGGKTWTPIIVASR